MKSFISKIGSFLVTSEIFEDKKSLLTLYRYFLIGLIIRLLFLPFFFQRDLLSTYQRAAETISTRNLGLDNLQFFTNMIHTANLFITRSIFPAVDRIFPALLDTDTWFSWVGLISSSDVYTILVLFKIPYLIFDIACMFLVLRLAYDGDIPSKLRMFKYWIFNPLVIFVSYIFARHDIIGLFVTMAALLLAKRDRKYWAVLVLAIGIALRFFPILILPLFILYLAKSKKDYIIFALIGVSGLASIEALLRIFAGKSVIIPLLKTQHFEYFLSSKLELIIHDKIFIFIVVYMLIILSFLHIKKKNFDLLICYGAIIYLSYIALCYFHPQYTLWTVPFLVIAFVRRKSLIYYHWIQFGLLLVILIYWGDLVTTFVLTPIDHEYFIYMTGIIPFIERFYDSAKFVNLFRSIFSGISLWMVYLIYKDSRKLIKNNE